jgi:subtilase family serine protease
MHKRAITAVLVTGSTVLATALVAAGPATAKPSRTSVPRTRATWTANARQLGKASNQAKANARVYLTPQGGLAALKSEAVAVATKGNPAYHHFLTASQYRATYAPTNKTVRTVSKYLRASGLQVTSVAAMNRYITVHGTVAAAEKAFGTQIARYRHDGHTVQAPTTAVRVPANIAAALLTVTGLDTTRRMATHDAPPPAGFRNARPCSVYYGQVKASTQADFSTPLPQFGGKTLAYAPCGYNGPQFRAAYEGNTNLDGSGVTVGIVDAYAAPTIASDANTYGSQNGDGSYASGQLTQNLPPSFNHQGLCGPSGWYGEETLDVEAVHAMAPGADIRYYAGASCEDSDLNDALARAVDEDTVQLVSDSWGEPQEGENQSTVAAFESVFLQGSIEGISFMFSSGDEGDEVQNTGIKQADYPTSDPYVTSVGGTSTGIGGNGNLQFETGWGTVKYSLSNDGQSWNPVGYLYGAGGGTSSMFNRPAYQDGTVSNGSRQVPDVAMDADPNTGMLIGETQTFPDGKYYDQYRIGGTSLASPLFTGMTALSLENAGSAEGLLNPTIYSNQGDFTDVTQHASVPGDVRVDYANSVDASNGLVYSVRTFNQDASLHAKKGYDLVTGLGSPNSDWLGAFVP